MQEHCGVFWTICCATKWFLNETADLRNEDFNEHLYNGWPQQYVVGGLRCAKYVKVIVLTILFTISRLYNTIKASGLRYG